jgi:hypothetical protein
VSTLEVTEVPKSLGDFARFFDKHVDVFGVHVFAKGDVDDDKILHCAHVLAQYLDNDENGVADDPDVVDKMVNEHGGSGMIVFAREADVEAIFDTDLPDRMWLQDLYATEILPGGSEPGGSFDATLEEVLHLVTFAGWHVTYPDIFGLSLDTELSLAMDTARGGRFSSVPSSYPDEAWYHYDDRTCDYYCMMVEYIYWGMTSWLGAQDYAGRCDDIDREWELCSPEAFEAGDPTLHALITDPAYPMPSRIPDGAYDGVIK